MEGDELKGTLGVLQSKFCADAKLGEDTFFGACRSEAAVDTSENIPLFGLLVNAHSGQKNEGAVGSGAGVYSCTLRICCPEIFAGGKDELTATACLHFPASACPSRSIIPARRARRIDAVARGAFGAAILKRHLRANYAVAITVLKTIRVVVVKTQASLVF